MGLSAFIYFLPGVTKEATRMGALLTGLKLAMMASLTFFSSLAKAYSPSLTAQGVSVHWGDPAYLPLAGRFQNKSGLKDADVFQAVVHGLERWKKASNGTLQFDYWQGSDLAVFPAKPEYNGFSSLFFASQSQPQTDAAAAFPLPSNVLGLTQVWFHAESGEILETDIVLNDIHYRFTMHPGDTSGYGLPGGGSGGSGRNVFIENVITHELGHAFGLSHSGVLQSTMLYMESPEQAHLGCDEQVGLWSLYSPPFHESLGTIRGKVFAKNEGTPVFGAHVLAISRARATVIAASLTDASGEFVIQPVEPGDYYLLAEPFTAGASALSAFYANLNPRVCPGGRFFSRSFLMEKTATDEFELQKIQVVSGKETHAPDLFVSCEEGGGAAVARASRSRSFRDSFTVVDLLSQSPLEFSLRAMSGRLEIHALSYSLYAPVQASLALFDEGGRRVQAQHSEKVFIGESGYTNFDSLLLAENLLSGNYRLRVSGTELSSAVFPAGPFAVDPKPFVLLIGSLNEVWPRTEGAGLPWNPRCQMDEHFPPYVSPPGGPLRKERPSEKEERVGFCGAIADQAPPGSQGPSAQSPSAAAIAGWWLPMLGWVLLFLFRRLSYSHL